MSFIFCRFIICANNSGLAMFTKCNATLTHRISQFVSASTILVETRQFLIEIKIPPPGLFFLCPSCVQSNSVQLRISHYFVYQVLARILYLLQCRGSSYLYL